MPDDPHRHLDALSQTDAYKARLRYREAPRPHPPGECPGFGQLGHMLDTLKDAVLFMRHVAVEPALDVADDHAYKHLGATGIPPYVELIAGDPRLASSFHRTDTGRAQQASAQPDLAAFMNRLHALMRKASLAIGRTFVIPPRLADDIRRYDGFIDRYGDLLDRHRGAEPARRDYRRIPEADLADFAAGFEPLADRLYADLASLPSVDLMVEGHPRTLPNGRPLNDRLKDTAPALVLFAFRTLGLGAADNNKRPATLEYDKRQRELIGAQSMITDTTQALLDLAASFGFAFPGCPPDLATLSALARPYGRSFRLALAFCRTAGCSYDALEHDLIFLARLAGVDPGLTIETPAEAALMLYALERNLARRDLDSPLRDRIRRRAADLAGQADFGAARVDLGGAPSFHQDMHQLRTKLDPHHRQVAETLARLDALFPRPHPSSPGPHPA